MSCRYLSRVVTCAPALFLLLATTVPAAVGATCGTWSNPPTSGANVQIQGAATTYPTLAAAVAAASSGDTVEILVPSLDVGPVTIPSSLTTLTSPNAPNVATV